MTRAASYQPGVQYLFDRTWGLEIAPPGGRQADLYGNEKDNGGAVRVLFEVEKTVTGAANKGKIGLYNISPDTRDSLTKGYVVKLRAGYRHLCYQLFVGYVRKVSTEVQGPDVVTTLECGDGEPVITYGFVSLGYVTRVSLAQVLSDIAEQMKLPLGGGIIAGTKPGVVKGVPDFFFERGICMEMPARRILDQVLKPLSIDWSIQDGRLNILPRTATTVESAEVVSQDTGLIGIPSFTEKNVKFSALLNPNLRPGCLVQLISQNTKASGYYRLATCKYGGDSYGGPWQVECEATSMPKGTTVSLVAATGGDFNTAVVR